MAKTSCSDKNGLKKGPWTAEEDQKLIDYIQKHGHGRWRTTPKNAGLKRCGKSCRLRWTNYLRPDIKRGKFSIEEEDTIIHLHSILGNKWSTIAARLPGRTDNEIKNYWNTHIKKRLLKMGIDPVTHKPRVDLVQLYSILNSSLYNSFNQFNVPNSLGIGSLLGPDMVNVANYLLSTQGNNDQNQFDTQSQAQLSNLEPIQAQNQTHLSGSSEFFSNEAQVSLGQVSNYNTNLGYQDNLLQNPWQAKREPSPIGDNFLGNCGDYDARSNNQAILNTPHENLTNLSFGSFLWTPSSTTCFNGGVEDVRDGHCTNNLMFSMPNYRLDISSGFM